MRRLFSLLAVAAAITSSVAHAGEPRHASSWVFSRSYYSHDPVDQVRIGTPYVPGGPYYSRPQGAYVKSGYRWLNSQINVGGQSLDHVNIYESWVQTGEQY